MINVVIVDDQALVRAGLVAILETQADLRVVGQADDGRSAVPLIKDLRPDVVMMDIRMPQMDGIEAVRRLNGTPSRILMLTTFDLDEYVYSALKAGASGFLLKDAPPESLVEAVRAAARDEALLAPAITRRLIEEFLQRPEPGAIPERLGSLTAREREVLVLIGRGLSNSEIAEHLFLSVATVKTHVTRTLTKLRLRDRAQAVVLAYESGLVRPGEL